MERERSIKSQEVSALLIQHNWLGVTVLFALAEKGSMRLFDLQQTLKSEGAHADSVPEITRDLLLQGLIAYSGESKLELTDLGKKVNQTLSQAFLSPARS